MKEEEEEEGKESSVYMSEFVKRRVKRTHICSVEEIFIDGQFLRVQLLWHRGEVPEKERPPRRIARRRRRRRG